MTEPWPLRATPLADRIQDIAREIRGPDDEGRLMFNTLYDIGEQVAALTAERDSLLKACADALEWINDFGMHSPVRFGGEAELANKLTKALGDEQDDRPKRVFTY